MIGENGRELSSEEVEALAKADGFKSATEMFAWFDSKYDLSRPKKFHVYRWSWNVNE